MRANHDTMAAILLAATVTPDRTAISHVEDAMERMSLPYTIDVLNGIMAAYNRAGDVDGVLRTVDRMVLLHHLCIHSNLRSLGGVA